MSKEYIQALDDLFGLVAFQGSFEKAQKYFDIIEQALQRLEAIDNAKPSEAFECLNKIVESFNETTTGMNGLGEVVVTNDLIYGFKEELNTIKQALVKAQEQEKKNVDYGSARERWKIICQMIKRMFGFDIEEKWSEDNKVITQTLIKAQEQEKENAYIEKIKTMMKQKDCALRYIESEDCFAVKTILSDGWYKLTPELVESNVREEIKPLPLIEKNRQLKEENAELKKALKIIKEKDVDIYTLTALIENKGDDALKMYNDDFYIGGYRRLTQEEFELLKRWYFND